MILNVGRTETACAVTVAVSICSRDKSSADSSELPNPEVSLTPPHSCPYAEDVLNDDDPEYCTCDEQGTQDCGDDI